MFHTGEVARSEVLSDEELAGNFEEEKDFGTRVVNRCGQSSKQEGQQEPGQTQQESGLYTKCNRKPLHLWAGKLRWPR